MLHNDTIENLQKEILNYFRTRPYYRTTMDDYVKNCFYGETELYINVSYLSTLREKITGGGRTMGMKEDEVLIEQILEHVAPILRNNKIDTFEVWYGRYKWDEVQNRYTTESSPDKPNYFKNK